MICYEENNNKNGIGIQGATFIFSLPISKENSSITCNKSEVNKLLTKQ
jgi:hypothetical protein